MRLGFSLGRCFCAKIKLGGLIVISILADKSQNACISLASSRTAQLQQHPACLGLLRSGSLIHVFIEVVFKALHGSAHCDMTRAAHVTALGPLGPLGSGGPVVSGGWWSLRGRWAPGPVGAGSTRTRRRTRTAMAVTSLSPLPRSCPRLICGLIPAYRGFLCCIHLCVWITAVLFCCFLKCVLDDSLFAL